MCFLVPVSALAVAGLLSASPVLQAQAQPAGQPALSGQAAAEEHRRATLRLYLHDGSFQVVTEYHLAGAKVRFYSAERADWEELPTELVDVARTQTWNREHATLPPPEVRAADVPPPAPPEDPERPTVAPHLRLNPGGYLYALDSFRNLDELTPLRQEGSIPIPAPPPKQKKTKDGAPPLPLPVDAVPPIVQATPLSVSAHRADGKESVHLRAVKSATAVHIPDAVFFVRSNTATDWILVRVRSDVNHRDRVLTPVTAETLQGIGANALALKPSALPGGVWTKLTPVGSIPIGQYALVQVLPGGRFDEHVWDFAIDPTAKENQDAIQPDNAPKL